MMSIICFVCVIHREPENHLKEQVDELLKKIKSLLRGDSFSVSSLVWWLGCSWN